MLLSRLSRANLKHYNESASGLGKLLSIVASVKTRLYVPRQYQDQYKRYKEKHVQKKLNIQFCCFYLLMTVVAVFRAAHFLLYG